MTKKGTKQGLRTLESEELQKVQGGIAILLPALSKPRDLTQAEAESAANLIEYIALVA